MPKGKFYGGGGGGNMNNMLRQAQKMQQDMEKMQQELELKEVEASAGGGVITVKLNGKKELIDIVIQPEAAEDIEMLQDLVMAAVNEGLRKAEEMVSSQMSKITGNLNIPGLF